MSGAKELAKSQDRYPFEWWALGLIGARPAKDKKKGADGGVDGYIFLRLEKKRLEKIVVR